MASTSAGDRSPQPAVVVVETGADHHSGHFPVMFAELAAAFAGIGCRCVALTARGWALADDPGSPRIEVRTLGPIARRVYDAADRLRAVRPRSVTIPVGGLLGDAIVIAAARRLRRAIGADRVVITSWSTDPFFAAAIAGRGRWLVYQWDPPVHASRVRGGIGRAALERASRAAQAHRLRRGDRFRVTVNNPDGRLAWEQAAPWLDAVQLPVIAARPRSVHRDARTMRAARDRLGLEPDARYALLFGSPHRNKDYDAVWHAFARLDGWTLIMAGDLVARAHRDWMREHPDCEASTVTLDGFVTPEARDLLHDAADVAILSFKPARGHDSGTFVDALAAGTPVVCSRDSYAGDQTERFGLGAVFTPGDVDGLVAAVIAAPSRIEPDALAAARDELSPRRMAERHLAAMEPHTGR